MSKWSVKLLNILNSCSARFFINFLPSEPMMKKVKSGGSFNLDDMPKGEPFEPKCIYDVLGSIKSECLKGKQEDAEEFLSSVLNGLHDEMVSLFKLTQPDIKRHNGDIVNSLQHSNGHIEGEDIEDEKINYNEDDSSLWKEVGPRHKAIPTRSVSYNHV